MRNDLPIIGLVSLLVTTKQAAAAQLQLPCGLTGLERSLPARGGALHCTVLCTVQYESCQLMAPQPRRYKLSLNHRYH